MVGCQEGPPSKAVFITLNHNPDLLTVLGGNPRASFGRCKVVVDGVKELRPLGREDTKAPWQSESPTPGMAESERPSY